jgi:hypothetical protein
MNFIEKVISTSLKNLLAIFLKYPSIFISYFYILLLGKILYLTYNFSNYRFGDISILYAIGLIAFIVFNKLFKTKASKNIFFSILLIMALFLIYYGLKHEYFSSTISDIKTVFINVYNNKEVNYELIRIPLRIIIPVITFIMLQLDVKGKGIITIVLFSIPLINALIYFLPSSTNIYVCLFVYLSFLYGILCIYYRNKVKLQAKKIIFSADKNMIISFAVIFPLVMVSLSTIGVQAFGTQNINDMLINYKKKHIKYEEISKKTVYSISKSGFGNEDKLGGSLSLNNDIAFRVKSDKPYYLRGIIKDRYDGFSWVDTLGRFFLKNGAIFYPTENYKKYMLGDTVSEEALLEKTITIYPETLESSTLFSPYNSFNVKSGRDLIGYTSDRTFQLLNRTAPSSQYSVNFYESSMGLENFINSNANVSLSYKVPDPKGAKDEYYENTVKRKYLDYLQIPNNISKETYALVYDIVKDCTTTEDKLNKIYEYLKTNYKYSLEVSQLPKDQEFLHNFLFNEKKGYCTYFATATVIFSRIIGVPARYVEGFMMDEIKDTNGLYIVGNDKAHAWAEILINSENNIWSVLDPVPVSNDLALYKKLVANNTASSETALDDIEIEQISQEGTMNKFYDEEIAVVYKRYVLDNLLKTVLYILVTILLISPFIYTILKIMFYKKYKTSLLRTHNIEPIFSYSKKRLEALGIICSSTDTEFDFLDNIKDIGLKNQISVITSLYQEEYYGEKKVRDFDKLNYYYFIESYIKQKQNILKYWYNKYFKTLK